jgi:hypothetical protein
MMPLTGRAVAVIRVSERTIDQNAMFYLFTLKQNLPVDRPYHE